MLRINFFLLLFLVPLLAFSGVKPLSKVNSDPKNDSAYIQDYINENYNDSNEDNDGTLQSIAFEYAPGNWFKILSIEIEYCGTHCFYEHHSLLFYQVDDSLMEKETDYGYIRSIVQIEDSRKRKSFLVSDESGYYASFVEGVSCSSISGIVIDDSLHDMKFFYEDNPTAPQNSVTACLSTFCSDTAQAAYPSENFPMVNYDKVKKTITCRSFDHMVSDADTCYLYGGMFRYVKGEFRETEHYEFMPKEEN